MFFYVLMLLLCIDVAITAQQRPEKPIVVVAPTYNNELYCLRNIQSVAQQTYKNWHMIIINDHSTDSTWNIIQNFVAQNNLCNKITLINNTQRKGALQNLYETIHECPDWSIVVTLDGDDWFATPQALHKISQAYYDKNAWITYGQFIYYPYDILGFCRPFPEEIIKNKQFRQHDWVSSHPRSFYAWLFKRINKEDLLLQGNFFPMAWDLAIMFPMLEMASNGHICCLQEPLYAYNDANPLNDHKKDLTLQRKLSSHIASKAVYPTF